MNNSVVEFRAVGYVPTFFVKGTIDAETESLTLIVTRAIYNAKKFPNHTDGQPTSVPANIVHQLKEFGITSQVSQVNV